MLSESGVGAPTAAVATGVSGAGTAGGDAAGPQATEASAAVTASRAIGRVVVTSSSGAYAAVSAVDPNASVAHFAMRVQDRAHDVHDFLDRPIGKAGSDRLAGKGGVRDGHRRSVDALDLTCRLT